jgi:hypothetical protein
MTGMLNSLLLDYKLVEQLYECEEKDIPTVTYIRENKRQHNHTRTHTLQNINKKSMVS